MNKPIDYNNSRKNPRLSVALEAGKTLKFMDEDEKDVEIILADVEFDCANINDIRVDLNVIFNPKRFYTGLVQNSSFYLGCTGADISILLRNARVKDYTPAQELSVNYRLEDEYVRNSSVTLRMNSNTKGESHIGTANSEYKLSSGVKKSLSSSFENSERQLAPVDLGSSVRWIMSLPMRKSIIRDYVVGNLYLFSVFESNENDGFGSISINPLDFRFFDHSGTPISSSRSILMLYYLFKNGILNINRFGTKFSYTIDRSFDNA